MLWKRQSAERWEDGHCKEQASKHLAPLKSRLMHTLNCISSDVLTRFKVFTKMISTWFVCVTLFMQFLGKKNYSIKSMVIPVWLLGAIIVTAVTVCITRIDLVHVCCHKMNISEAWILITDSWKVLGFQNNFALSSGMILRKQLKLSHLQLHPLKCRVIQAALAYFHTVVLRHPCIKE